MSMRYAIEIDSVTKWYDSEGKKAKYWVANPLWPDEMMATKERIQLRNDAFVLIDYLEQEKILMAYHCADELKINLKNLVREMLGPGMVAHIARTSAHHIR